MLGAIGAVVGAIPAIWEACVADAIGAAAAPVVAGLGVAGPSVVCGAIPPIGMYEGEAWNVPPPQAVTVVPAVVPLQAGPVPGVSMGGC